MSLISKKKAKVTSIILTLLNITFVIYAVLNFDLDVISIRSFVTIQFLIILFYLIVYTFNLWTNSHLEKLIAGQTELLYRVNSLEKIIDSGFDHAVNSLKENNQKEIRNFEHRAKEDHYLLFNLLKSSSEENDVEIRKRREDFVKLNEKISTLQQNLDRLKEQETDSSGKLSSIIADLKQDVGAVSVQGLNTVNKLENSFEGLLQVLSEMKILGITSSDKLKVLIYNILQNIDEIKTQEADTAHKLGLSISGLFQRTEEMKDQEADSSLNLATSISALSQLTNQIKELELNTAQDLKTTLSDVSRNVEELKIQEGDVAGKLKYSIDAISQNITELKTQEIGATDKLKVLISGLSQDLDKLKLQETHTSTAIKNSIVQLYEHLEIFKKQESEMGDKFAKSIAALIENVQNYNAQELESLLKVSTGLTEINNITNGNTEKIGTMSIRVKNLIEQIEKYNSANSKDNGKIFSTLDGLKIDHQNKVETLRVNLINAIDKIEINKKEIEQSSLKLSDAFSNKANWLDKNIKGELSFVYDRIDSLFSIHRMIDIKSPLPIMNEWAISSDYGLALLKTTIAKGEGNVIDVGSGISTIILGYILQKRGKGKVIALEHDRTYFQKSHTLIKEHHLEDFVELNYCPLKEYVIKKQKWLWYDISKIKFPKNIAVINIDGPPGATQEMARFPAIPLLLRHIGPDTSVFLDDGGREDEKKIAEKWVSEYNFKTQFNKSHKGYFVFESGSKK